jgi:anthranilate synthase component 2
MLLLIDNYDSFTYNLVHYFGELGTTPHVVRNDALTVQDALAMKPEAIVLSPGPCDPAQAGICLPLRGPRQARACRFSASASATRRSGRPSAARGARIRRSCMASLGRSGTGKGVFAGLPSPLRATRYHSLVVERDSLPDELEITAELEDGTIMGLRHRTLPIEGVQFHPESIRSEHGHALLKNFLTRAAEAVPA